MMDAIGMIDKTFETINRSKKETSDSYRSTTSLGCDYKNLQIINETLREENIRLKLENEDLLNKINAIINYNIEQSQAGTSVDLYA